MKINHKLLIVSFSALSLCSCSLFNKTTLEYSGLIDQSITIPFDESGIEVNIEDSSIANCVINGNQVTFSFLSKGSTPFTIKKDKKLTKGTLNTYDFSYEGAQGSIIGKDTTLTVKNLQNNYTFSSSDESIATISDDGVVSPLSKGQCNISLTYNGATYTKPFYVEEQRNSISTFYIENSMVNFYGRNDYTTNSVTFYNGASGFEVSFFGSELKANLSGYYASYYGTSRLEIYVDGKLYEANPIVDLINGTSAKDYTLVTGLEKENHVLKALKTGEAGATTVTLNSLTTNGYFLYPNNKPELKIEVYGDSITAGYGNMRGNAGDANNADLQNANHTYAVYAANELDAQINVMARSGIGLQRADNITGDFNMDTRYEYMYPSSTTKWNMHNYIPDVVVINLGTNDTWTPGLFKTAKFYKAYLDFVFNLISWYGEDTLFVCCCGLMSQGNPIYPILEEQIIPTLQNQDVKCVGLEFTNTATTGHPIESEHITAGHLLANTIEKALKA